MARGILGRKVGMTQIFLEDGTAVPVTVIQAGPCHVLQVRSKERDGYEAVQLGFLDKSRKKSAKRERGHVASLDNSARQKRLKAAGVQLPEKANCEPKRFIRELRGPTDLKVGNVVDLTVFEGVAAVDVVGHSRGRGFAGPMTRHHFKGMRATHGSKKNHRHPGSTGCRTSPGRVFKGLKMHGRHGNFRVTARNLKVIRIDKEENLLLVRGAVPGHPGTQVIIQETNVVH
jgi:large subunit ribosomal protein L3